MQKTWVRILTTAMTLAVMLMIFLFSTQQAEKSDATSGLLTGIVARMIHPDYESWPEEEKRTYYNQVQRVIRKCAHFTEFAMLGLSLRLCLESWLGGSDNRRRTALNIGAWIGGACYAGLDEWHQTLVDGRSGQVMDVGIDSCGVLTGLLLALLLMRLISRRAERTP